MNEEQTYIIRDRGGHEIARSHRVDMSDGDKKFWWTRDGVIGLGGLAATDIPLYGIDQMVPGGTVVVTEGAKARDALAAAGFMAVATTCGASGTPSDDVLRDLQYAHEIVLWPDNDDVGREHMRRIAERLQAIGLPSKTLRWTGSPTDPLGGPKPHDDAYDFFEQGLTRKDAQSFIDEASLSQAAPLIGVSDIEEAFDPDAIGREAGEMPPREFVMALRAKDFVAADIADPRYLVERIWPEQAIGFIAGQPKVFKSFLSLDLAFAVATGGMFLGQYKAPEPRRVLIVQNESSKSDFRNRLREVSKRFGGVPDELIVTTNYPILLDDKTWVERMTRDLEKVRPALMILDPLRSMMSSDEDSATEVGDVVRLLREWRDKYEMAIAIVHHNVKDGSGRRTGNKMSGTGALYGAAEVIITMERPDDDAPRVSIRIEMKETESPKPFFAEFYPEGDELRVQTPETLVATDQLIVDFLTARGEATVAEIASNINIRVPIVREVVKALGPRGIRLKPGSAQGNRPAIYYAEKTVPLRLGVAEE